MTRDEARELRVLSRRITAALVVVAVVAMVFTAVSVTTFALDHGVSPWVAWTLDPMVAVALLTVLLADARLVELGAAPSGWATALRWFAGAATWVMNAWSSVWPGGGFGVPRDVDAAGVVLHSVAPVLLVVLAEAATGYRRVIAARIRLLEGVHDGGHPSLGVVDDDQEVMQTHSLGAAAAAGDHLRGATEMVAVEDAVSSWDEPWHAPWDDPNFTPENRPWDDRATARSIDPMQPAEVVAPHATRVVAPIVGGWSSTTTSDDHLGDQPDDQPGDHSSGHPVATEVVAPVVTSRPSDDRADDHLGDQPGTSCDPRKTVAPVVKGSVTRADAAVVRASTDAEEGPGAVPTPAAGIVVDDESHRRLLAAGLRTTRNPEVAKVLRTELDRANEGRHDPVSDADLRKAARRLNRDAIRDTRRPVTVEKLQTELGLSRRRAAELRREVVAPRTHA